MDEKTFQEKLAELMKEISTLPKSERDKLTALAACTQDKRQDMRKIVKDLQESLDYLRLSLKYLIFDLEATRRENTNLLRIIANRNNQDGN